VARKQEVDVTVPGERGPNEELASTSPRLRPATLDDIEAVLGVAVASSLFPADEVEALREVMEAVLDGRQGPDHQIALWADAPGDPPAGVVYFGPDPMADRKWDLWMIAVNSDRQGQGIGGKLLRYTEARVRAASGRLLLIETSSLPKFEPTRAFYLRHGYREVARIPDFYADGDSKVIFAKRIGA
jgi:ribosomal protein S18 acetylase RimI-like enzyme